MTRSPPSSELLWQLTKKMIPRVKPAGDGGGVPASSQIDENLLYRARHAPVGRHFCDGLKYRKSGGG